MSQITSRHTGKAYDAAEWQLRVDLAAAFRLAVHFDWHESVGNHFSAAVSADGKKFLLNPKWQHFSTIRASDLLLLDADDPETMKGPDAPDPTAWCIHGAVHAAVPNARVLLHCHPAYATALATLKDPSMKPIDQNTARFFNRMAIDLGFAGLADEAAEGQRIARAFGNHSVMMMGNHGVTVAANTVAEAFEDLYFLERAAKTLILAYSTGQELNILSDEIAEKTARSWEDYKDASFAHFDQLKAMLDKSDPSYRE
ncbi:class II aldolase/adducin family protein [Kiloniella laminariae]|uniref:class II aldolase/adducin family protein n=1 Tax=Kiloniella laminariae TaxID=454162 RepID=UPI00037B149B|nr:class II aldolase/adducin family protein [Kiloniella laminariae]